MKRRILKIVSLFFIILQLLCSAAPIASAREPIELTPEEQDYISSHKTLRIGYVQDRVPVSFSDENGEFAGISRYIFDYVSELCGMDFEYVPLPAGDVTYDYLLSADLDLVSSVEYNKENQKARGILISDPYLSSRKVVVAREGLVFSRDAEMTIAISTGSQTLRKVLSEMYPHFKLIDYPSIDACFDAVNSGEADLMIQNQYVVEYWLSKPIYEKLKVIPVPGLDDQLCFSAVVKFGENSERSQAEGRTMIDILNKTIASISEDEIGSCTIQGIMDNQYQFTVSDFLYRYRYAVRASTLLLLIILVLAFLLIRLYIRYTKNKADAKAKNRFLSTMSHELRTPLNGLIGLNQLMTRNADDTERVRGYLKQSNVTANYLLSLVNDMLDMSELKDENPTLSSETVELELMLKTVDTIAKSAMSEKGLTYELEYDLTWPYVSGDGARIQQVLMNLLDNARKFTPQGGRVTLSLSQKLTEGGAVLTTAVVSDNGCGMSEDFQKQIFDIFAREPGTVSKGNQGTGLGLPISRRLALLMGGDLTFTSRKGEGSSFTFTFAALPAAPPQISDEAELSEKKTHPRILAAEDNELNAEILIELLRESGFEADLAENGRIALDMFSKSEVGTYGVILMDLLMPEMNGFEAAKAIRSLNRSDAKTVRIFACTANTSDEDRKKAAQSGMDDFVEKPVDINELIKLIG